ncbi:mitochondrial outer membrane translocase complex, subunit Tom20 domain-containing protein [Mrakia frigida]|uniref:TOM complex receptor protein TOM20 n=1 Tax=Mrakia frigida TaxID=29902 RepID=UPI003FCC0B0D
MSPNRATTIAIGVGAVLLTSVAGYAVWFDYRRQTDKDFRRKIRKQNKKVSKVVEAENSAKGARTQQDLISAIIEISQEPTPTTPEESEKYFMENVAIGEKLSTLGPDAYVHAATSFYRALRIYPAPAELMQIYEKTVLPPVFAIVKELIGIANVIAQQSSRPAEAGIDGGEGEEDEEAMIAALQAAVAGAGRE